MKIFFRYLFLRLFQPFCYCLAGFTVLWVMADLYGTMEDFLDHKVRFSLVLYFYLLQIPHMLVQILPAAVLFSTLFTLLSLNRRSEFVALQAGGLAPILLFSPFLVFGVICTLVLAYDMSGPAAKAMVFFSIFISPCSVIRILVDSNRQTPKKSCSMVIFAASSACSNCRAMRPCSMT